MIIQKLKKKISKDGFFLFLIEIIHRILNKIFNLCLYRLPKTDIDYTARIRGLCYVEIGENFHAGKYLWLEAVDEFCGQKYNPRIIIKDNVIINDFVHIGAVNYVEIGNNVLFASKVYVTDHNHGEYMGEIQSNPHEPPTKRYLDANKKVIIKDNVWIGEHVSILPNVKIGEGCIIGSNSVVTKNIPDYTIAVGAPAIAIKKFNFITRKWDRI